MTMQLHSECFSPDGNLSAEGYENLMGTPSLDLLSVLVRESTQNACDAMCSSDGGRIRWRVRKLSYKHIENMKAQVFTLLPEEENAKNSITKFLSDPAQQWVLEIIDSGTTGLGGPTRADQPPVHGENPDFVNFFKNIGAARDVVHGGGTYGYGKTTLYRASRCNTIIVDTLTTNRGKEERRLLAAQLGRAIPGQYTGRHWWGHTDSLNRTSEPIRNKVAERVANALGFYSRESGQYGTSIMIVSPHFINPETQDYQGLTNAIEENLLWYFWPRMMASTEEHRKLHCEIWRGQKFEPVRPPESFPPLNLFTKSMNIMRGKCEPCDNTVIEDIKCRRPQKHLGKLSILQSDQQRRPWLLPPASRSSENSESEWFSIIPEKSHHVALMRPAELVVKYLEGGETSKEGIEWAGVFRCDDNEEVELAFAHSEPPAHDDWKPEFLPPRSRKKSFVTVALREIKKLLPSRFDTVSELTIAGSRTPLGKVSDHLGKFLSDISKQGGGAVNRNSGRRSTKRGKTAVSNPEFIRLDEIEEQPVAFFRLTIDAGEGEAVPVKIKTGILIEGAFEDADEITGYPEILECLDGNGTTLMRNHSGICALMQGTYKLKISIPGDSAIAVKAEIAST